MEALEPNDINLRLNDMYNSYMEVSYEKNGLYHDGGHGFIDWFVGLF